MNQNGAGLNKTVQIWIECINDRMNLHEVWETRPAPQSQRIRHAILAPNGKNACWIDYNDMTRPNNSGSGDASCEALEYVNVWKCWMR